MNVRSCMAEMTNLALGQAHLRLQVILLLRQDELLSREEPCEEVHELTIPSFPRPLR